MSLRERLRRLEGMIEEPTLPAEVVVRHRIIDPTPDGPRDSGEWIRSTWRAGVLVERQTGNEAA